jgi:hypothetical protein
VKARRFQRAESIFDIEGILTVQGSFFELYTLFGVTFRKIDKMILIPSPVINMPFTTRYRWLYDGAWESRGQVDPDPDKNP